MELIITFALVCMMAGASMLIANDWLDEQRAIRMNMMRNVWRVKLRE